MLATAVLSLAALTASVTTSDGPFVTPAKNDQLARIAHASRILNIDPSLLVPTASLPRSARVLWPATPVAADFNAVRSRMAAAIEPGPTVQSGQMSATPSAVAELSIRTAQAVPLPIPRPAEFGLAGDLVQPRSDERRSSRRTRTAAVSAPQSDNRSFFEKLFNLQPSAAPGVTYAALGNGDLGAPAAPRLSPVPVPSGDGGVAVYDISARTVRLPNGETLEAHSGLGEKLDDPRFVHIRMRGATPPGTYDLTEREQLFHGVRALRLTPVGGSGAVFGRAGLLAHTFMLGPNGDSNGCVSFRDYERFLQAYVRGEVRRLVVVLGNGRDAPASNRLFGMGEHTPSRDRGA